MRACLLVEQQRGQSLLGTGGRPKALFDIGKDIGFGFINTYVDDFGGHVVANLWVSLFRCKCWLKTSSLVGFEKSWMLRSTYSR